PGDTSILSFPSAATNRRNSLALVRIKTTNRIAHASRFGPIRAKKLIGLRNWCATLAGKTLRGRDFAKATIPVTTPSFSKTPTATTENFAAGRGGFLRFTLEGHPGRGGPWAFLQAPRLPLHLESGRFKNEEPGASRTCYFAGRPPCSVSQADRAFQNRQGRASA